MQCDSDCAMLIDGGFCSDWDTLLCSKPASDVVLQGPKYNGVPTGTEEKDIRKCANFCKVCVRAKAQWTMRHLVAKLFSEQIYLTQIISLFSILFHYLI